MIVCVRLDLRWRTLSTPSPNVEQHDFIVERAGRSVPGVLWMPAGPRVPRPAVLLGHGGSGDKYSSRNQRLGQLINAARLSAVAIDGPYHGERVAAPLPPAVYQQLIVDEGVSAVTEHMTADWLGVLSALHEAELIGDDPVSYIGVSMGGRFGLPLAAALGPRLGALVIGNFGLRQTPLMDARLHRVDDIARAAVAVVAPTLLHMQWDDEVFPREGQLALFDVLGAPDKRLLAYPGLHTATPPGAEREWTEFVVTHLTDRADDDPLTGHIRLCYLSTRELLAASKRLRPRRPGRRR